MPDPLSQSEPDVKVSQNSKFQGGFRQIFDPVLSLFIAVLLIRTFLVEGYLISTGSMAPHYHGQHKRATCPECRYSFAVGTEFDDSDDSALSEWATCPNCFSNEVDISQLSTNRGDHLLVWKNAYQFRAPRRWEVVVFRNPNSPLETYLKRVVGKPGEEVEIKQGNIWINGQIARKPWEVQRATRVPVFDTQFPPEESEEWIPRWTTDAVNSGWTKTATGWKHEPVPNHPGRLTYRHTLRYGGNHQTKVCLPVPASPEVITAFQPKPVTFPFTPEPAFPGLRLEQNCLLATGVVSPSLNNRLRSLDASPAYLSAIEQIIQQSHFAPVTDFTAYNQEPERIPTRSVSEFFLEATLLVTRAEGAVSIELSSSAGHFSCELDMSQSTITLLNPTTGDRLRTGRFVRTDSLDVEFSSFDRQLSVSINGQLPFEAWELESNSLLASDASDEIASFSGNAPYEITSLRLYRDIYYTGISGERGVNEPVLIPSDEYFVLGDNSPVSSDSRRWEHATVPHKLFIGKPIVVHLPSTQESLRWGNREFRHRQPDFSRIRFVR